MIDATPDNAHPTRADSPVAEGLLAQAMDAHRRMDYAEAETAYRAFLQDEPLNADANHNLGVLLAIQLLRPMEALPYFEAALNEDATSTQFWFSYIDGLIRCEYFDMVRQVLPLAQAQGLSRAMFNALSERLPVQAAYEGETPHVSQEPTPAEQKALVVYFQQKSYVQGEAYARALVERCPESGFAWKALGAMLQPQGKKEEALEVKKRAVQLLPNDVEGLCNLGRAHFELGQIPESIAVFRATVAVKPDYAEAFNNLGLAFNANGQIQEAHACFERAVALQPDFAEAYNNLSGIFNAHGQVDEAMDALQHALASKPDHRVAFDNLLFVANYHPDKTAEAIYEIYADFERRFGAPHRGEWQAHNNPPAAGRRLKVGYVSPDFKNHACTFFMEPLLAHHDPSVVDVYAYAELTQEDGSTQRYKRYVE
ncbi:MAG: tetratricopeptide repeat protein, partial [Burkholderiales bacterium]|nr:tetratricopeptide repeat protein [Burkholderiales bacterium]